MKGLHVVEDGVSSTYCQTVLQAYEIALLSFDLIYMLDNFIKALQSIFESFQKKVSSIDLAFVLDDFRQAHLFCICTPRVVEDVLPENFHRARHLCLVSLLFVLVVEEGLPDDSLVILLIISYLLPRHVVADVGHALPLELRH